MTIKEFAGLCSPNAVLVLLHNNAHDITISSERVSAAGILSSYHADARIKSIRYGGAREQGQPLARLVVEEAQA